MLISANTGIAVFANNDRSAHAFTCDETIRVIAQAGFDGVDLGFVSYGRPGMPMAIPEWRDWVAQRKAVADECGIQVNLGHAHYYSPVDAASYTQEDWERVTGMVMRDIEAAGICKAPWIVVHPDTHLKDGNYSRKESLRKEYERFSRLGEHAAKFGVGLAIENMPEASQRRRFCGSHEDLLELLDLLGDDERFGVCWDTGHANLNTIDQGKALMEIGSRLRALHINDNMGKKDDHVLPFLGNVNWQPIMQALHDIDYQGAFNYEIHGYSDGFPKEYMVQAVRFAYETAVFMLTMAKDNTK